MPMPSIHAERHLETAGFGISSQPSPSTTLSVHSQERERRRSPAGSPACRTTFSPQRGLSRAHPARHGARFRSCPPLSQNPGRNLRPHFPLSTPRAASRLVTVGKLKGISSASRWAVCHPQLASISGALHASALTLCRVGRLLAAPVALLGQLPRGAKGVAVVTCPPSAGL